MSTVRGFAKSSLGLEMQEMHGQPTQTASGDYVKAGGKRYYIQITVISCDERPPQGTKSDHDYWLQWLAKHDVKPESLQSLSGGFQAFWNDRAEADRAYEILLQLKSDRP